MSHCFPNWRTNFLRVLCLLVYAKCWRLNLSPGELFRHHLDSLAPRKTSVDGARVVRWFLFWHFQCTCDSKCSLNAKYSIHSTDFMSRRTKFVGNFHSNPRLIVVDRTFLVNCLLSSSSGEVRTRKSAETKRRVTKSFQSLVLRCSMNSTIKHDTKMMTMTMTTSRSVGVGDCLTRYTFDQWRVGGLFSLVRSKQKDSVRRTGLHFAFVFTLPCM